MTLQGDVVGALFFVAEGKLELRVSLGAVHTWLFIPCSSSCPGCPDVPALVVSLVVGEGGRGPACDACAHLDHMHDETVGGRVCAASCWWALHMIAELLASASLACRCAAHSWNLHWFKSQSWRQLMLLHAVCRIYTGSKWGTPFHDCAWQEASSWHRTAF